MNDDKFSMFAGGTPQLKSGFESGAAGTGAAGAASGFDPMTMAVMTGMNLIAEQKKLDEVERQERMAQQNAVNNRMSSALGSLVNLSRGFNL